MIRISLLITKLNNIFKTRPLFPKESCILKTMPMSNPRMGYVNRGSSCSWTHLDLECVVASHLLHMPHGLMMENAILCTHG